MSALKRKNTLGARFSVKFQERLFNPKEDEKFSYHAKLKKKLSVLYDKNAMAEF